MMYSAGLVVVIRTRDGKIVREYHKDGTSTVLLPFGSDYKIGFKNQDVRRAVVKIEVDGVDVMNGSKLVINGNSEETLEGFMDPSGVVKNAFRFIEKTDKVRGHRGNKIDDGIVRIEFQFEEQEPIVINSPVIIRRPKIVEEPAVYPWDPWSGSIRYGSSPAMPSTVPTAIKSKGSVRGASVNMLNAAMPTMDCCVGDQGITVKGAEAHQEFRNVHLRRLDPGVHVMVFELKGMKTTGAAVKATVTTRKKLACPTCGTKQKSGNKFCGQCSTALV